MFLCSIIHFHSLHTSQVRIRYSNSLVYVDKRFTGIPCDGTAEILYEVVVRLCMLLLYEFSDGLHHRKHQNRQCIETLSINNQGKEIIE